MATGLVAQDGMPGRTFIRNLLHFIQRIRHLFCTRLANQYADSCPVSIPSAMANESVPPPLLLSAR